MAGQVTVSIELADGTVVARTRHWTGGNSAYEGIEAQAAAHIAADDCRAALDATHGTLQEHASSLLSRRGGLK